VRNDTDVNFNWGQGSPDPAVPADNFSARWTRTLNFEGRVYRFSVLADDGVRVFVDNAVVIDEWHSATSTTYTADVNLAAGLHILRIEYYEATGDAYIVFTFAPAP
jgi:PA14 domain-containing protein